MADSITTPVFLDTDPSGEFQVARSKALWRVVILALIMPPVFLFLRNYFQQQSQALYRPTMLLAPDHSGSVDEATQICSIRDPQITEASGLAVSRRFKGCVWIHNDSGDTPRLFLVDRSGTTRLILEVDDAKAQDWEDMCSFEKDGKQWLLIGDTGDNGRVRKGRDNACRLYLIEEPKAELDAKRIRTEKARVRSEIEFTYPAGPVDCESLGVDVKQNLILLVSKTDPFACHLYSIPLQTEQKKVKVEATPLKQIGMPWATGMDVSPDGLRMAIINPLSGVMVERQPEESWTDALSRQAQPLTLPIRRQGETVCFSEDGKELLLNSEGQGQPLWSLPVPARD